MIKFSQSIQQASAFFRRIAGKNKKGRTIPILCFLLLFTFVRPSFAETIAEAPIMVDGQPVKTAYFLQNGHLMVPALFFKNTGASVDWNVQYQSVVVEKNNTIVALYSGKNYADYYTKESGNWVRDNLPTTTTPLSDGTYIPLLYTAQKLGMKVTYNSELSRTFIDTNTPPAEKPIVYYVGDTTEKKIALTFDDGPDSIYTPQILDILLEKGVHATFFVLGQQVKLFPELTKRIVNEGHLIANHTWSHPELPKLTTSQVVQEVESTRSEIAKVTGINSFFFRPPYGSYTAGDIRVLSEHGYRSILWSVDTLDWSGLSAEEILAIVNRDKSPGGIILQHDFQASNGKLDGTVQALPKMIDQLRGEGYQFVTVQNLLDGN
ncbi:polysaccharide deacetylase family protein [Neobacillus cucumis]|uniref:polysaccharide deacetylase family protein n=1 Tax=Neobacillus cucumis TaxID=1740721 RepID=UPI0028530503|nr:polysaccharide deacetylase family protein [Neobacillus cucumis]MDR4947309.1 polysaccharide deacetylase family protein [Neobacillus cucumis]